MSNLHKQHILLGLYGRQYGGVGRDLRLRNPILFKWDDVRELCSTMPDLQPSQHLPDLHISRADPSPHLQLRLFIRLLLLQQRHFLLRGLRQLLPELHQLHQLPDLHLLFHVDLRRQLHLPRRQIHQHNLHPLRILRHSLQLLQLLRLPDLLRQHNDDNGDHLYLLLHLPILQLDIEYLCGLWDQLFGVYEFDGLYDLCESVTDDIGWDVCLCEWDVFGVWDGVSDLCQCQ